MHYAVLMLGENPKDQLDKFVEINSDSEYRAGMFDYYLSPFNEHHRWPKWFKLKNSDENVSQAFKREIDLNIFNVVPAYIIANGELQFHADFDCEEKARNMIENASMNSLFTIYDCHN